MGYAVKKESISPEFYLELERKAEFKSELINGEMIAKVGTTRRHNLIIGNIYLQLRRILKTKPCKVYTSDLRVQVSNTGLFTYPDILITCGKEILTDIHKDTILNPKCIMEVLSDSTEKYDRGEKFFHYRQIETLEEYILISQDQYRVESFLRKPDNKWLYQSSEGLSSSFHISTVNALISLEEVYSETEEVEEQF